MVPLIGNSKIELMVGVPELEIALGTSVLWYVLHVLSCWGTEALLTDPLGDRVS